MKFRDEDGLLCLATAQESRDLDEYAIERLAMPGRLLMEIAGQGAAQAIALRFGGVPGHAVILCGRGNNGGDGYVVARALDDRGWRTQCLTLGAPLAKDAIENEALYRALGGTVRELEALDSVLDGADLVVDALFGTGLNRPLAGAVADALRRASALKDTLRVALDLPSGICADTGQPLGESFVADLTLTFGLPKLGLYHHPARRRAGEVATLPIGAPREAVQGVAKAWRELDHAAVVSRLPERPPDGHKGRFGHVGVVGGAPGMEGAALLAARGALRSGCGLVTWNGFKERHAQSLVDAPEVMFHDVAAGVDTRSTVLVVGPGLAREPASRSALQSALQSGRPCVVDTDALHLIAALDRLPFPARTVLTPHPGEAAAMLGRTAAAVQADRPQALRDLVDTTGGVVLLKGANTLIGIPESPGVIVPGDAPALSVGGSGDVLSGIIAGLMAQGLTPKDSALCGAWLHAVAGQRLGEGRAHRGVSPVEIADIIPTIIGELELGWSS